MKILFLSFFLLTAHVGATVTATWDKKTSSIIIKNDSSVASPEFLLYFRGNVTRPTPSKRGCNYFERGYLCILNVAPKEVIKVRVNRKPNLGFYSENNTSSFNNISF